MCSGAKAVCRHVLRSEVCVMRFVDTLVCLRAHMHAPTAIVCAARFRTGGAQISTRAASVVLTQRAAVPTPTMHLQSLYWKPPMTAIGRSSSLRARYALAGTDAAYGTARWSVLCCYAAAIMLSGTDLG
eukprot:3067730-Rhodomonas_salina.3